MLLQTTPVAAMLLTLLMQPYSHVQTHWQGIWRWMDELV
jgi:hypothetical protein